MSITPSKSSNREDLFGARDRTRAARVAYSAYACVKDICAEVMVGDYQQNIRTVEELSTDENVVSLPSC